MSIISNSHVDAHLLHLRTWTSPSKKCGNLSHKMSNSSSFLLYQGHWWHRIAAVPSHLLKKPVVQTVRNWSESWTQIKIRTRTDKKAVPQWGPPPSSNTSSRKTARLTMSIRKSMTSRQGHLQRSSRCNLHQFLTSSFSHRPKRTSRCIQRRLLPNGHQWFNNKSRKIIA